MGNTSVSRNFSDVAKTLRDFPPYGSDQLPGTVFPGSLDGTAVVLGKALLEARGQAHIPAARVRNALEEVDGVPAKVRGAIAASILSSSCGSHG